MKKYVIPLFAFSIVFSWNSSSFAQIDNLLPAEDSEELRINDMLMLLLGDKIDQAVSDYYSEYLTVTPLVYPYQIEVVDVTRVGGFRTFHFLITLEITPVVGPHISVGKDRLIFEVSPLISGLVKLKKFEHLETHELPPHLQRIIKQKQTS